MHSFWLEPIEIAKNEYIRYCVDGLGFPEDLIHLCFF
jgi:hypothetical protein